MDSVFPSSSVGNPVTEGYHQQIYSLKQAYLTFYVMQERWQNLVCMGAT